MAWVRALTADAFVSLSTLAICTGPSPALAWARACPLNTARAAFSASSGSDLPPTAICPVHPIHVKHVHALGQQIAGQGRPVGAAPSTPARLTAPDFLAHFSRSRYPAAMAGNSPVASTIPITESTAATWASLCVSTPNTTSPQGGDGAAEQAAYWA
jgi:hypothetical protein